MDVNRVQALLDFIVDNAAPGLDPEIIADLFDRMIWMLADNGDALLGVVRTWLDGGDDLTRVKIALAMEEGFVYSTRGEMEAVLGALMRRYPQLNEQCKRQMDAWDATVRARR